MGYRLKAPLQKAIFSTLCRPWFAPGRKRKFNMEHEINLPEAVVEMTAAFMRYEAALTKQHYSKGLRKNVSLFIFAHASVSRT